MNRISWMLFAAAVNTVPCCGYCLYPAHKNKSQQSKYTGKRYELKSRTPQIFGLGSTAAGLYIYMWLYLLSYWTTIKEN